MGCASREFWRGRRRILDVVGRGNWRPRRPRILNGGGVGLALTSELWRIGKVASPGTLILGGRSRGHALGFYETRGVHSFIFDPLRNRFHTLCGLHKMSLLHALTLASKWNGWNSICPNRKKPSKNNYLGRRLVGTTGIQPVTPTISTSCCLNFDHVARRESETALYRRIRKARKITVLEGARDAHEGATYVQTSPYLYFGYWLFYACGRPG